MTALVREHDEERGAHGTNSPEPTEKHRPNDSSKESEGSRELWSINGEGPPPESCISLDNHVRLHCQAFFLGDEGMDWINHKYTIST